MSESERWKNTPVGTMKRSYEKTISSSVMNRLRTKAKRNKSVGGGVPREEEDDSNGLPPDISEDDPDLGGTSS